MPVSDKTRILVWSRSGHQCAMCRRELFVDECDTDDTSLVGDIAHIVGEKKKAARGMSSMPTAKRHLFANLVLLCKEHHKIVDDHAEKYSVEALTTIKKEHEKRIDDALSPLDRAKQRSIERFADILDHWTKESDLENWEAWTSFMLGGRQPEMDKSAFRRLQKLREWLFGRVWPDHFPEVRDALENYRRVLADLLSTFKDHAKEHGDRFITEKFYQNTEPGTKAEIRASKQFDFHVDLVFDLTLELTRAANFVCDAVRRSLDTGYRLKEGLLVAMAGPDERFRYDRLRVQYAPEDRAAAPYRDLEQFKVSRKDRDYHWGEGVSIDDPNCRVGGSSDPPDL